MDVDRRTIYLVFETDAWLSHSSETLVYVGDDLEECIAEVGAENDLTFEQRDELLVWHQLMIPERELGYVVLVRTLNEFV